MQEAESRILWLEVGGILPATQREDFVCSSRKEVGGGVTGAGWKPFPGMPLLSPKIQSQVYPIHELFQSSNGQKTEGAEFCLQGLMGKYIYTTLQRERNGNSNTQRPKTRDTGTLLGRVLGHQGIGSWDQVDF